MTPASEQRPDTRASDVRRAYLDGVGTGYFIYAVGAVTAFLAATLSLSDAQAGLHSSAMAIGLVVAGLICDRLDARIGNRVMHAVAFVLLGVSVVVLAWPPAFAASLAAAAGIGFGCGIALAHINMALSAVGGMRARLQLTRSSLIALVSSMTVPLVIGLGIAIGVGWQFVAIPALVLVSISLVAARGRSGVVAVSSSHGTLPRGFWLPWLLVVGVVAVEFSIVFWGSSMVARSTGTSLADATLTISGFIAGMIVGRSALSVPAIGRYDPLRAMRVGLGLALAGSLLLWATASFEVAMAAMLLAGLGVGALYPLGASITIASVPGRSTVASSRLVMASGLAVLVAPFVLGSVADVTGIVTAWLLVPGIAAGSLALTFGVSRVGRRVNAVPYPIEI